jgi:4-amino-4-deoxy-L-arabinose transferase-like glycosyltransferase
MNAQLSTKEKIGDKSRFKFSFPVTCFITIGFGFFVYLYLIRPLGPFAWDEAHHSTFSLLIAKSLLRGEWGTFLSGSTQQIYWPFLHSWFSSVFLMIGGFTYQAARISSLSLGCLAIFLIYRIGSRISPESNRLIGLLAAGLLAISPIFQIYSSLAMIENLGLVITLILIRIQFKILEMDDPRYRFIFGVVLGILFLTKYIYAIFFILALVLFWISRIFFPGEGERRREILDSALYAGFGFFLVWGLWMAIPPTLPRFAMVVYRIGDTGSWNPYGFTRTDNLVFYWRSLFYAYTFSLGIYFIYLGGLIYGLFRFKDLRLRFLCVLFFVNMIAMSLIVNNQERFIYTTFPALVLLTAIFITRIGELYAHKKRWLVFSIVVLLVAGDLYKLPDYIRQIGNQVTGANCYTASARFSCSTFFGLIPYPEWLCLPGSSSHSGSEDSSVPHDTGDVIEYVRENTDSSNTVCAPFFLETLSPHLWKWHSMITERKVITDWSPESNYFVTLNVEEGSPYLIPGNRHLIQGRNLPWIKFLQKLQERSFISLLQEKKFPDIGLTVSIFKKTSIVDTPAWNNLKFP